jgi:hypothetical protein
MIDDDQYTRDLSSCKTTSRGHDYVVRLLDAQSITIILLAADHGPRNNPLEGLRSVARRLPV